MFSRLRIVALVALTALLGCGAVGPREPEWPPVGKKWFDRAEASYRQGDVEDAALAVEKALKVVPDREVVRVLGAKVAIAQLQHDEAIRLLHGIDTTEARAIRGRAYWYSGQLTQTADELDRLLSDPEVRDPWATAIAKLARRGSGRTPFRMTGGLLAAVEMPRVAATSLVVPLEVNGEQALGLIATRMAEAVVDGKGDTEPSWVSLRFGERVEVKDVPALSKDLSGISRELNAPIKILLGVNLIRHLRPTFDFRGSQFVVRTVDPPPPPAATTVKLSYLLGGGMLMRGALGREDGSPEAALMVDTLMTFPLALNDRGWKKVGIDPTTLQTVPTQESLRYGTLPVLRIGAFELPDVASVYGAPIEEMSRGLGVELDGLVGSGLLAAFRVTLADGGRTMWLEDMPQAQMTPAGPAGEGAPSPPGMGPAAPGAEPVGPEPVGPETEG